MAQNIHIIGRQIIDLEIGGGQDAFRVQQDVSFALRNRVLPKLEELFDRLVGPERVIRIDQLEIDLGDIDPNSLERELEEKLMRYVERALNEHLFLASEPKSDEREWKEMTRAGGTIELWIYFLEHGYLPWYAAVSNHTQWEAEIIEALSAQPAIRNELMHRVIGRKRYLQRLVCQFSAPVLEAVLGAIVPSLVMRILELRTFLFQLEASSSKWTNTAKMEDFDSIFWHASLAAAFLKRSHESTLEAIAEAVIIQIATRQQNSSPVQLLKLAHAEETVRSLLETNDRNWIKTLLHELEVRLEKVYHETLQDEQELSEILKEDKSPVSGEVADPNMQPEREMEIGSPDDSEPDRSEVDAVPDTEMYELDVAQSEEVNREDQEKKLKEGDFLYIRNAGLVILHPFLPRYFETLGLTDEKAFVDEQARGRAVQLIQYLATGVFDQPEYQLTLNKILCGHPLSEPIAREIVLTKTEKIETQKLLQAVITHWTALKNTSPEGLQYNYFLREGKLTRRHDGWLLQVETKTQDILMNQLPWGISMIQMPWMEDLLRIEWAY